MSATVPAAEETKPMVTDELQNPQIEFGDDEKNKLVEGEKPKNDDDEDEDDVLTELVSVGSKVTEHEKDSNEGSKCRHCVLIFIYFHDLYCIWWCRQQAGAQLLTTPPLRTKYIQFTSFCDRLGDHEENILLRNMIVIRITRKICYS